MSKDEDERQLCGMPAKIWLEELRKTKYQMTNRVGLVDLGLHRIPLPDCNYHDCVRMNRGVRIAMWQIAPGQYRCNDCAAVEATKKRLGVPDGN